MSSNKEESSGIVHSGLAGAKPSAYGASCLVSLKSMSYLRPALEGELAILLPLSVSSPNWRVENTKPSAPKARNPISVSSPAQSGFGRRFAGGRLG